MGDRTNQGGNNLKPQEDDATIALIA